MLFNYLQQQSPVELGWTFYLPVIGIVALIACGVPVWVSIGAGSIAILALTEVLPLSLVGEALFDGIDAFALIAVPLFVLTGDVLVRTGLSNRLLDIADATTGGFRAGLGTATVLGCGFFSCISGSDAAGAAAVGRMTMSRLVEEGYPKPYACALVASGACTGILIPPSIAYIVIGLVLGVPTSTLFIAAVVPGVMVLLAIMATNVIINRFRRYEDSQSGFSLRRWLTALKDGRYALLIPFIILGGIYSGIFTPTEAAAVAVLTTIIIGLSQKTIGLRDFPRMLESSAKVCGVIVPIIAMSLPFAQTLAILDVPQNVIAFLTSLSDDPRIIILVMIGILMAAGCIMEATPNVVILAPILMPVAMEIGMDEVHFCIMLVTAIGVGFITPPLGLNLFVLSGITGTDIIKIAWHAVPFVFAMIVVVLLVAFIPELSLFALDRPH